MRGIFISSATHAHCTRAKYTYRTAGHTAASPCPSLVLVRDPCRPVPHALTAGAGEKIDDTFARLMADKHQNLNRTAAASPNTPLARADCIVIRFELDDHTPFPSVAQDLLFNCEMQEESEGKDCDGEGGGMVGTNWK